MRRSPSAAEPVVLLGVIAGLAVLLLLTVVLGLAAVRSPGMHPVTVPSVARA